MKKTREPSGAPARLTSRSARAIWGRLVKKFEMWIWRGDLRGEGRDEVRMVVSEGVDGDAAEKVEIGHAVDVPHPAAVANVEDEGGSAEDAQERSLIAV